MIGLVLAAVLAQDAGIPEPVVPEPVEAVADAGVAPPVVVPAPAVPVAPAVAEGPTAHWALWAQPLGTVGYGAGGVLSPTGATSAPLLIYVPIGANIVLSKLELVVELTVTGQLTNTFLPPRLGVWASAGPLWHLGPNPLNGFFVQPKLLGALMVNVGQSMCGGFCGTQDQGLGALGLDVGYQLTFRKLYVAFVAGFAMGAGNFPNMQVVTPWTSTVGAFPMTAGGLEPVVLVNLNLLRIGGWN